MEEYRKVSYNVQIMKDYNGKLKAVTISFDDGMLQDIRLIELMNKYGLKGTFNLNSERFGAEFSAVRDGKHIWRKRIEREQTRELYRGHEVAAHTLTHKNLTTVDDAEMIRQVELDRLNLSEIVGYEVVGLAYAEGGVNCNEHVADVIRNNTGIKYARTIVPTYGFKEQHELLLFNPTCHISRFERAIEVAKTFIDTTPDSPMLLYLWGHSYEMDLIENGWEKIEEIFRLISNKNDVFYGTNKEILLS